MGFNREDFRYECYTGTVLDPETKAMAEASINYRVRMPDRRKGKVPLILFLHGSGERGTDNEGQLRIAVSKLFESPDSEAYNSVVIAPQCPPEPARWVQTAFLDGLYSIEPTLESSHLQLVAQLLKQYIAEDYVDARRVYVIGLSMGGYGTWDMLSRHGELFAAGVPICGGGDPKCAKSLSEIPIYTFHGTEDTAVSIVGTRTMVAAIRECGKGLIRYAEFAGAGHGIWDHAILYRGDAENPPLLEWLFAQKKG